MSKAKKDILNRIENLFSDIGDEEINAPVVGESKPSGWTWGCDAQAFYTACSPAVMDHLGISYRRFIGNALFSYRLYPQSRFMVKQALQAAIFPQELNVYFEAEDESWVLVRMHITRKLDDNEEVSGWTGFNLVINRYSAAELEEELKDASSIPAPDEENVPQLPVPVSPLEQSLIEVQDKPAAIPVRKPVEVAVEQPTAQPLMPQGPTRTRFSRSKLGFENMERLPYPDQDQNYLKYRPINGSYSKRRFPLIEILFIGLILILAGLLTAIMLGLFN